MRATGLIPSGGLRRNPSCELPIIDDVNASLVRAPAGLPPPTAPAPREAEELSPTAQKAVDAVVAVVNGAAIGTATGATVAGLGVGLWVGFTIAAATGPLGPVLGTWLGVAAGVHYAGIGAIAGAVAGAASGAGVALSRLMGWSKPDA